MTEPTRSWRKKTLKQVADWSSGGTPAAKNAAYYGGDIPWAVIGDLSDGLLTTTAKSITQAGLKNSSAKLVPQGTVLVGMYGSIGKLGITAAPMTTNQAIAAARPYPEIIDTKFLFYYLMEQRHELGRAGRGAAQQNIGQGILKAWPIYLPELAVQHRIVEVLEDHLSRLDAATAYTNTARRRLTRLAQAARQHAVDAPASPLVPLAELVERIETGKSLSGTTPASDDEWGIIKVSAMTWGSFRPEENKQIPDSLAHPAYEIREGDLLVSRANTSAYVGASVLVGPVRPRLLLSDKSLRVVPRSGVDARWLNEVLLAPRTRQQVSALSTGTKESMRNISQKALLSVAVPNTPPAEQLDVMAAMRTAAEATQSLSSALDRTASRAQLLRRALLSAAFSGRLTGAASDLDRIEELAEVDA